MYAWLEHELGGLSTQDYAFAVGIAVFALIFLLVYAYGAFRRFRVMDATATSRIRSAAQGYVELKGLGEWLPAGAITSPFSKSRCIWFHCTIDRKQRSGKRVSWSNILDLCSDHLFRIVDDTGECIVNPERAHVVPESEITWYGRDTAAQHKPPRKSRHLSFGDHEYRFRERLIRPATQIYALGWFRTIYNQPHDEFINVEVDKLVADWKLAPGKYLREFDLDGNGSIQNREWKAVRHAARNQILRQIAEESKPVHLMSRPADKSQPFIVSAVDESSLVRRKKVLSHLALVTAFLIFVTLVLMYSVRPWI